MSFSWYNVLQMKIVFFGDNRWHILNQNRVWLVVVLHILVSFSTYLYVETNPNVKVLHIE